MAIVPCKNIYHFKRGAYVCLLCLHCYDRLRLQPTLTLAASSYDCADNEPHADRESHQGNKDKEDKPIEQRPIRTRIVNEGCVHDHEDPRPDERKCECPGAASDAAVDTDRQEHEEGLVPPNHAFYAYQPAKPE